MDRVKEALYRALNYKPWPSQLEFHESPARFKSLFAGSRYGKSLSGARDVLPDILKPKTRGWIVGPTYEQPSKEFRYIYQDLVVTLSFKPSKELNPNNTSPGTQMLLFPWGSEVHTKSEENLESLLGEEVDWMILSEGSRLKETTYDMYLRARLGSRLGRLIVPTTPHGYNWLYKRFYLPSMDGEPDYWSKIVSVIENKNFPMEEYERAKKELSEETFREQYDGEFVAYSGLIYKRFSRQYNVIKPFKVPSHWVRYMSIDPHPSTATAILWLAVDENDTLFLYDEMFIPNLTIPEISERIKAREGKDMIYKRLIDPNAKYVDKLRGQTASVQMQFAREGISCQPANNKFESAYYKISELLAPKEVYGKPNVKSPNLFVFSTLKETIQEFESCNWENEKDNHMLDNCFSDDTEVLTENGWKFIHEVNNESVATISKEGKLEYQHPTAQFYFPYKGEMIQIKVKSNDFFVTPNHRMLVNSQKNQSKFNLYFSFKQARNLSIWDRIPLKALWDGQEFQYIKIPPPSTKDSRCKIIKEVKADLFYEFLGWYLSEGCCVHNKKIQQQWSIRISQSVSANPEKYKEIENLLSKLPWKFQKFKDGFNIQSRQLWEYLSHEFGSGNLSKKISSDIKKGSSFLLKILFDSFIKGDGWTQRGRQSIASCSRRLIDDFQEIALKIGKRMVVYQRKNIRSFPHTKTLYVGYITDNDFLYLRDWKNRPGFKKTNYNAMVSCLSVPNETLYVRRNGRPIWCGNCKYIVNDNPVRTWRAEELTEIAQQERERLRDMNPLTGY